MYVLLIIFSFLLFSFLLFFCLLFFFNVTDPHPWVNVGKLSNYAGVRGAYPHTHYELGWPSLITLPSEVLIGLLLSPFSLTFPFPVSNANAGLSYNGLLQPIFSYVLVLCK